MTERNPIPPCLSHLEQMLPKRPSNTAMHFLIKDLRNYAKVLTDGDSDHIGVIAEMAGETMLWAVESLEGTPEQPDLEQIREAALREAEAACDRNLTAPSGGGLYSQGWIAARETCRKAILALMRGYAMPPDVTSATDEPGMTEAERHLLLTVAGWLEALLCGRVLPDPPHSRYGGGSLTPLDAAGVIRSQIDAVRREGEG